MSPQVKRPRCNEWMPQARTYCARVQGHGRPHMTEAAVRKAYDRTSAYHKNSRSRRYEKINAYKLAKGCIDCGYADNPVALDFDHRDQGLKILGVAAMLTYAWPKIVAELDKCDVRCANCHRVKTYMMHQSQYRRRPVSGITEDGPHDEITDHLPGSSASGSSAPPP